MVPTIQAGVSDACEKLDRRERRKAAIIAAARELFVERGFESVTLGEIVRLSGGSLTTLYDLFQNKSGLLGAVLRSEQFARLDHIQRIAAANDPPYITLRNLARLLYDEFLHPEKLALFKIVMAESLRDAQFARDLFEQVHVPFVIAIADLFARWKEEGRGEIPNPKRAALFFIALVLHPAQSRGFWGDLSEICAEDREIGAEEAARLLVRGYRLEDVA